MNSITVLVLAIALTSAVQCRADLIDDTCSKTPYPETCTSALRSDPRSGTADTATLGLIVVDKVADSGKKTVKKIKSLLGSEKDPKVKAALSSCSDHFEVGLVTEVGMAKEAFTKGNPKFAVEAMTDSKNAVDRCEKEFQGKSPITAEDTVVKELSAVAAGIASLLL